MWLYIVLIVLGLVALTSLALAISRARLDRANAKLVEELLAASESPAGKVFRPADLEGLPAPVRRYLSGAISQGHPYMAVVRLHQAGEFRPGDRTSPWKPFTARQYFTANPPGFIWDATIMMAPLLPVRVIDVYKDGAGTLRGKLLSTFTVAEARGPRTRCGRAHALPGGMRVVPHGAPARPGHRVVPHR
jgi:hypothetical protein